MLRLIGATVGGGLAGAWLVYGEVSWWIGVAGVAIAWVSCPVPSFLLFLQDTVLHGIAYWRRRLLNQCRSKSRSESWMRFGEL